jgi:hypothetical protein
MSGFESWHSVQSHWGPGGPAVASEAQCAAATLDASAGDTTRAGCQFASLLPSLPCCSLQSQLAPFLSTKPGTAPVLTQVLLDSGRPVTLRLSDRTTVQLDTDVTLSDALQQLLLLQQRWTSGSPHGRERCVQLTERQGGAGTGCSAVDIPPVVTGLHYSIASAGPHAIAPAGDDAISDSAAASHNAVVGHTVASKEAPLQSECAAEGPACDSSSSTSRPTQDVSLAAAGLFSTGGCLGVPGSCHRVCAVQDTAGSVCGVTYCLQAAVPGAAGGLADVLSGMKASLSVEGGTDR